MEQLRALYPENTAKVVCEIMGMRLSQVYNKATALGLEKSAAFLASDKSGRVARGRHSPSMVATQFRPGITPWNKGTKGVVGVQDGCRPSQFKAGQAPPNTKPVGSYRLNKEGHLQQKVSDAKGNSSKRWRGVAELVWCAANGGVPEGHLVAFKPGQFTNKLELITLDRLECISRSENMRRNSFRTRSPELTGLYQLKGAINRQINRIARDAESTTV